MRSDESKGQDNSGSGRVLGITCTRDRDHRLFLASNSRMPLMRVAAVSRTTQSQLLAMAQTMTEPKGAVLFRRDETAFGVFLVRKGRISLRLETEKGKVLWHRIVTRDSIVGLPGTLAGGRYSLTAVTLQKSELAFVSSHALIDLVKRDPGTGMELVRALGDEVLQMRDVLVLRTAVREA